MPRHLDLVYLVPAAYRGRMVYGRDFAASDNLQPYEAQAIVDALEALPEMEGMLVRVLHDVAPARGLRVYRTVIKVERAKKNPASYDARDMLIHNGHAVVKAGRAYVVQPYDKSFPTLGRAKAWIDKHVAAEKARANPSRLTRAEFDRRYWRKTAETPEGAAGVPAGIRRDFYEDYCESGLPFAEYVRKTSRRLPNPAVRYYLLPASNFTIGNSFEQGDVLYARPGQYRLRRAAMTRKMQHKRGAFLYLPPGKYEVLNYGEWRGEGPLRVRPVRK